VTNSFFLYSFKFSGDDYSSKNQGSDWGSINYKKPFHKNFKHDNGQIRNVHPKPRNSHSENENSWKNIEETEQNNEISENEDPVDDKIVNRHTELVTDDDTQGAGDTKGKVNDGNRAVKHSEKENSLKNSDCRGQILQNSHTSNGKKLQFFSLLKFYLVIVYCLANFLLSFLNACYIYKLYTKHFECC
jgi:hypothetical protein